LAAAAMKLNKNTKYKFWKLKRKTINHNGISDSLYLEGRDPLDAFNKLLKGAPGNKSLWCQYYTYINKDITLRIYRGDPENSIFVDEFRILDPAYCTYIYE
jgi:hypothetical protein